MIFAAPEARRRQMQNTQNDTPFSDNLSSLGMTSFSASAHPVVLTLQPMAKMEEGSKGSAEVKLEDDEGPYVSYVDMRGHNPTPKSLVSA